MIPQSSRQRRTHTPSVSGTFDILYPSNTRASSSASTPHTSPAPIGIPMPPQPRIQVGYHGYDAELGSRGSSSVTRTARKMLSRRGRWIAGAAMLGATLFVLSNWRHERQALAGLESVEEGIIGKAAEGQGLEKGKGKATTAELDGLGFIVNQYGDHFYPTYPNTSNIPPFDPDISLLPHPSQLFPEIHLQSVFRPPNIRVYPNSHLREVISPHPTPIAENLPEQAFPTDAYVLNWTGAADWDQKRTQGMKIQFERKTKESADEKLLRKERGEAVKRGFAHAWQAYKDHAWGHDEVKPVSKVPSDPFNNWGASIIDTLDTLLLLGFNDEYNLCRAHVNQLNFEWVYGKDWKHGYIFAAQSKPNTEDPPEEQVSIGRERNIAMGVFETGIRYLGGLLGAYDLSGDTLMLERAIDLAHILGKAYNTQSGLPSNRLDPGSDRILILGSISLAEIGTMTLELFRLSHITGDRQWHDLAQRTIDYLDTRVIPRSVHPPLIPLWFQPDSPLDSKMSGTFAWGGMADSYFEYLIKTYRLLGGTPQAEQYRRLYEGSVEASKKILYWDIDTVPGRDLLAIGKWDNGRPVPEIEHLTCFAGAMLGLGAKLLDRPDDMEDAEAFTESCYWLSAATPSGLQPEMVEFYEGSTADQAFDNISVSTGEPYHPYANQVDLELEVAEGRAQKDGHGVYHWTDDWSVIPEDKVENAVEESQGYYQRLRGVPAGTRAVNGRGINRPETIESIFYMYRLTGNKKWQDRGWKMFVSWMQAAKVEGGISSVHDVTKEHTIHGDNMESFTFAETFKYHYLLHADTDLLSLDEYVLNTEAHPLISNPNHNPGHSALWTPPSPTSPHAELGVRAQGTPAQKWTRFELLKPLKAGLRGGNVGAPLGDGQHRGGGKGMGGGGGRPGELPKLPAEFYMRPDLVT